MMSNTQILIILYLANLVHGWFCGQTLIEDHAVCLCGNQTLTKSDDDNGINCCGPATCTVSEDGSANCPEGEKCKARTTFPCGDINISSEKKCHCGTEQFSTDDYYSSDKHFCCPSSSPDGCRRIPDADGYCGGIT